MTTSSQRTAVDIAIIGGGVVGGLAALMLARAKPDWQIAVYDGSNAEQRDPRVLALAHSTWALLKEQLMWEPALTGQATPIRHIHVSDRSGPGSVKLSAERYQLNAFGYVAAAADIQSAIERTCAQQPGIQWHHATRLVDLDHQPDKVLLQLDGNGNEHAVECNWLIAADGQRSAVREKIAVQRTEHDYQQQALIGIVELDRDHQGIAYERFTEHGPLALLPHGPRQMALVWCVPAEDRQYSALNDHDFLRELQQAFGWRAGRFTGIRERAGYPLMLLLNQRSVYHRTVFIGNACHTIHPIAGQGYNLGVRDVADLAAMFAASTTLNHSSLLQYETSRQADYQRITAMTDGLVRTFSNRHLPLVIGRNLGLLGLRAFPALASPLARTAMGYRQALPARETAQNI